MKCGLKNISSNWFTLVKILVLVSDSLMNGRICLFSLKWMCIIFPANKSRTSVICIKAFRYFFPRSVKETLHNFYYTNYSDAISYYFDTFDTKMMQKLSKNFFRQSFQKFLSKRRNLLELSHFQHNSYENNTNPNQIVFKKRNTS